jgi:Esterase-like activity of phytase
MRRSVTILASLSLFACTDAPTVVRAPLSDMAAAPATSVYTSTLESVREVVPRAILNIFHQYPSEPGVQVWNTGLGSAVAAGPSDGEFWLMTDRGPNADYGNPVDGKLFASPDFSPRIALVRTAGNNLHIVRSVALARNDGTPISGFPLPLNTCGATGEKGYFQQADGSIGVRYDAAGMDSEGLAVTSGGDFWISDEYGPFIARYDAQGREQVRLGPCAGVGVTKGLPAVFAKRRANRGMEGLSLAPSGKLVGMMQSPLDNPRTAGRASTALRILVLDPANPNASSKQFVYTTEAPANLSSEVIALDDENFLVLERDGNFPGVPGTIKRVYKASVHGPAGSPDATDESDATDGATGKSYGAFGATLEAVRDFTGAGVVPLYKTLVLDLITDLVGYPHDKAEGIALVGGDRLVISNDDDFGVTENAGTIIDKLIPGTRRTDYNSVWVVRVTPALR